ncbi:MAG TPA: ATPase, T2SS/T4P/T4SS family [Acidimicrobiales bacterium]|nr:ATPase, T2SS/T4P/T4SS family [Acidimicrobiales bacterium]
MTQTPELADTWVSPLVEVERAVQARAKDISLDMASPEGRAALRRLIDEEVAGWSEDYKRSLRAFDLADPLGVAERAERNLAGYGPLAPLLDDDDVWEIMINGPDAIFVKRHLGRSGYHDEVFHDDEHVLRTLTKILDDAAGSHRKLDAAEGLQDAQLDTGARLHIVHGDVGRDNHVLVNIRKFTGVAYRSLDELVGRGMLDHTVARFLRACVTARLSIVFSGAPGSGKTTLLSCCAAELDPSLRVVIAEEVFEADIPLPNVAHMQTRPARSDRKEVDLRRLVAGFLRMAPDIAIVGEVRDRDGLRQRTHRRFPRRLVLPVDGRTQCPRPGCVRSASARRTVCSALRPYRPVPCPCLCRQRTPPSRERSPALQAA